MISLSGGLLALVKARGQVCEVLLFKLLVFLLVHLCLLSVLGQDLLELFKFLLRVVHRVLENLSNVEIGNIFLQLGDAVLLKFLFGDLIVKFVKLLLILGDSEHLVAVLTEDERPVNNRADVSFGHASLDSSCGFFIL